MRARLVPAVLIAWMAASAGWAGQHDKKCCGPPCGHCMVPPPPFCPKCTKPCDDCRLCFCPAWHAKETPLLIEQLLRCPNFQGRKKAAEKLGCRWHADFCQTPAVLPALIAALHCDACWEVRRAAATSIRQQNARTPSALLALYIASKLDPHYLVRERANESIDILLVLQRPCYKQLFKGADELIKKLRGKYKPGSQDCQAIYDLCGAYLAGATTGGGTSGTPSTAAPSLEGEAGPTSRPSEAKGEEK